MDIRRTSIDGLIVLEPRVFEDERGFFVETWNARDFAELGLDAAFVQDNHSRSARGVIRGLHFQSPNAQGKLVRVSAGAIYDVVVDIRRSSATYGKWVGIEVSAANARMVWIPPGLAHGFLTLEDDTDVLYKCTAFYDPASEHCLAWDDPDLAIVWPLAGRDPILSAKDRGGLSFAGLSAFA